VRLTRRVDALEAIAEEVRLRPYRRMARELGVPLDELLVDADEARELVDRLRAQGLSLDDILARCAAHWSIPLDELRRRTEDIVRRYDGPHA
jgi:hypothetical protein